MAVCEHFKEKREWDRFYQESPSNVCYTAQAITKVPSDLSC